MYYDVADEWAVERLSDVDPSGVHDLIEAKDDIVHRATPYTAGQAVTSFIYFSGNLIMHPNSIRQ
jgi:hypothetical protein